MKPGFYLVASINGHPLPPDVLEPFGTGPAAHLHRSSHCHIAVADPDPAACDLWSTPDQICAFSGYLDEPTSLAITLGLPPDTQPARLAAVALARFAQQASFRILGEWELAVWKPALRSLSLLSSRARRNLLYFHADATRVAASPDALGLSRVFGRRAELNPIHFALQTSRQDLRHILRDQSLWRDTCELAPATLERFTPGHRESLRASDSDILPSWQGTFDDAIDQLQEVGLRVLRQHLGRHHAVAFHLSGGQDSTLLTSWGAQARSPANRLLALCSAAPTDSGLRDESAYSQAAADQLAIPLELVAPPPDWNVFRPSSDLFHFRQHPLMEESQPGSRALQHAALAGGASALVSGLFGEFSVTGGQINPAAQSWFRTRREQLRLWMNSRRQSSVSSGDFTAEAFHVRFNHGFLQALPTEWRDIWLAGLPPFGDARPGEPIGLHSSLSKINHQSTASPTGLHVVLPYRDRRLLEAAAVLPSDFRLHDGLTRSLSRALLRGHVPEFVRLRTEKLPFAPDFPSRFQRQAPTALARVPLFQASGLGTTLDLPWLTTQLDRAAAGKITLPADRFQIQSTVIAAEFLLWVQSGTPTQ